MKLDLHVHTTASDGVCTPEEVVNRAIRAGLDVLSITDHDTAAGVAPAIEAVQGRALQILSGVELSSTHDGVEIHILAYGIDPASPHVEAFRVKSLVRREERLREIMSKLALQGVRVLWAEVQEELGDGDVAPARPHLARALVKKGYATSVPDAFARLIGDECVAFVPTNVVTPTEAVQVALAAGGVPVWAHPPTTVMDELLPPLVEAGLRGLEVYRPRNTGALVGRLKKRAEEHDLLLTGGSDWHGPHGGRELGAFFVTDDEIQAFLDEVSL